MNFICHDCEREFEESKELVDVEYYGSKLCSYTCPYCGGNFSEAVTCKSCGKEFGSKDKNADCCNEICPECMKKLEEKTKEFFKQFNENEIQAIFENILEKI